MVGKGFIEGAGYVLDDTPQIRNHFPLGVHGPVARSHLAGIAPFVQVAAHPSPEADGEGAHRFGTEPAHHGHHRPGINPPAQKGPQGNVADEPQLYRLGVAFQKTLDEVVLPVGMVRLEMEVPVLVLPDRPVFHFQIVARQEFPDAAVDGKGGGNIREEKIGGQAVLVHFPREAGIAEDGFHFRGEIEHAVFQGVENRLYTQPVPGHEQYPLFPVPQGEGEHAPEPLHTAVSPLFIPVDDDFGVGVGPEHVAGRFQFGPQFPEIVNFSVENHLEGFVFVADGLFTGRQVNDAQPPVPQEDAGIEEVSPVVRAAMTQHSGIVGERIVLPVEFPVKVEKAENSAHGASVRFGGTRGPFRFRNLPLYEFLEHGFQFSDPFFHVKPLHRFILKGPGLGLGRV